MNFFIKWGSSIISGPIFYHLKKLEVEHRVKSPGLTLASHVVSFLVSFAFSYYFGSTLISIISHKLGLNDHDFCCHHLPTLSTLGVVLFFIRSIIYLIGSVWYYEPGLVCAHKHSTTGCLEEDEIEPSTRRNKEYVEKYAEYTFLLIIVFCFWLYGLIDIRSCVESFKNDDKFNIDFTTLVLLLIGLIFLLLNIIGNFSRKGRTRKKIQYKLKEKYAEKFTYSSLQSFINKYFNKVPNYKMVIFCHLSGAIMLLLIVFCEILHKNNATITGFDCLSLVLLINLTIKELSELISCVNLTYIHYIEHSGDQALSYNIRVWFSTWRDAKDFYSSLWTFFMVTLTISISHFMEHLTPLLFLGDGFFAGISLFSQWFYMTVLIFKNYSCKKISCDKTH